MKKLLLFAVAILLTALSSTLHATLVLTENFDYPVGNLIDNGGWVMQGATTTNPIQVAAGGLTYPGYQDEAKGGQVPLAITGQDARIDLPTPITSGAAYASFLINVSSILTADYPIHLGDGEGSTLYAGRLFIKKGSADDKFLVGISRGSTTTSGTSANQVQFDPNEYTIGTTLIVVMKYLFVDGEKNDVASIYINPNTTEAEPAAASATSVPVETVSDLTKVGAFFLRQGDKAKAPTLTIDAVRVATAWADLFGTTPPAATPAITVTPKTLYIGNVFGGESYTKTINVKGKDLKGDITVAIGTMVEEVLTPTGEITTSTATITKAQAQAEGGYDLTVTLSPTDVDIWQEIITLSAEGATDVVVKPSWSAIIPIEIADLAALRAETAKEDFSAWLVFRVTGEVVVSHSYTDASSKTWIYIEDATAGMTIQDALGDLTQTYVAGDKIKGIVGGLEVLVGSTFFLPSKDFDAPISQGNTITPTTVTLVDLKANSTVYEGKLVKVEDVSFTNASQQFGTTSEPITQNGAGANMRLFKDVNIIGTTIPATANIIGISTSGAGNLIAPRSLADINVTSAVEQMDANSQGVWSNNNILFVNNSDAEPISIFNLSGALIHQANGVEGLQTIELSTSGLYIVKVGNKAAKVLVK